MWWRLSTTSAILAGNRVESDACLIHKEGFRIPVFIRCASIRNEKDEIIGACETFHDISPRIATARRLKELERLAMLDQLTQLANQRFIHFILEHALQSVKQSGVRTGI